MTIAKKTNLVDEYQKKGLTTLVDLGFTSFFEGNLLINNNELVNLKGSPKHVTKYFCCNSNFLKDLIGGPERVDEAYDCRLNKLTSLRGAPAKVPIFYCNGNKTLTTLVGGPAEVEIYNCSSCALTSLVGAPKHVKTDFNASFNALKTLAGAPTEVGDTFDVTDNELVTLDGAPLRASRFDASHNKLTSLEGIGSKFLTSCTYFSVEHNDIKSHVLGLFLMRGLKEVKATFPGFEIVESYLGKAGGLIDCQHALIDAGYEDLAQL
jgi:hypothetical protein